MKIKVIAFDADDTLWHNEVFFQEAEHSFFALMENYLPQHTVARELLETEIKNLNLYGYGIKAFVLSMIETAIRISENTIPIETITKIINLGKAILEKPVELLPEVETVLQKLKSNYRLVLATKGDLLDQERKLKKSGLEHYFHHIEIMTEKREDDYKKLIQHLDIESSSFMMIGNSIKSDVLPVLATGGNAIHIPYHITWAHERSDANISSDRFFQVRSIHEVLDLF
jgi:putative hydrolase of the HAD superfamily